MKSWRLARARSSKHFVDILKKLVGVFRLKLPGCADLLDKGVFLPRTP